MPLSFQNRNEDSPLSGFTPEGGDFSSSQLGMGKSATSGIVRLSEEQTSRLNGAAELLGTTVENFVISGFAALISRLMRQDMVSISLSQTELVRFDFEAQSSFQSACLRSSQRQAATPQEIEDLAVRNGMRFEFWAETTPALQNVSCELLLTFSPTRGDLRLSSPAGLWANDSLIESSRYLSALLSSAARNPELPISQLTLWSEAEAKSYYSKLNATERELPGPPSVTGGIALQISRRAHHVAIISENRRYTYQELDTRSSLLARELLRAGAGANRAVAVCMERSVDLPTSLLAVLKSGSFYVPLDPHNPSMRLHGILEECAPVALISDSRTADTIRTALEGTSIRLILADRLPDRLQERQPERRTTDRGSAQHSDRRQGMAADAADLPLPGETETSSQASNLAYTIYTSGTTGKPKGVRVTRGALLNLLCSMSRSPGIHESDRTLAVAPISFDIATMDMFLPLCSGGTLILASRSDAVDPYRLAQLVKDHNVTCMQATPATWRMLVSSGWKGKRDLKMITGGEAIARELVNDLVAVGGELWNCYGPTETTIYSAVIRLHSEQGFVPVGPPMDNTSFYVMDSSGNPLPPGVPGELCIGGMGVSPGYVARPELTAERFVPDRFSDRFSDQPSGKQEPEPGGRLFRTGDLVKLVDGKKFEFYGRLDHQVKLRGFRIELGEIESVLRAHPSLSDAVVVLREDTPGESRLVAYVILSGAAIGAATLREHAARALPEYMLPSQVVRLEKYPLSQSGKIDRKALPVPESVPAQIVPDLPEAEAPTTELESKLLKIFHELLRNETIGVTDSFFRFGGYSLLTVKLFSRIDRELHVRLPISLLFDAPTVRELAQVIQRGIAPSIIVPIRPQGRGAPLFIVQSYLLYSAMLEIVEPDRAIYGVREMGDEREPVSVEDRARRFAAEIVSIYPDGPILLAGWCAAGTLTVEIARQLRAEGHTVGLVALFDAERPGFAPPSGMKHWFSRLWRKTTFHVRRIFSIPWRERFTYMFEAMKRNWDWALETYFSAHYQTMMWLQKHFRFSLSEAAYNNVYASLSSLRDYSVRPYPGKLSLFRAADVPNFNGMDVTLGWGSIAQDGVDVSFVPGDHVSMFKKPHITNLAHRLQHEMKKSEESHLPVA